MAKKKTAARKGRGGDVNKSEAIRQYKAAHPEEGPTAIVAALAEQGISVSAPQVSNALSTSKSGGAYKVKKKQRGPAAKGGGADTLTATAEFIETAGGIDAAKKLIDAAERLSKMR